MRRSVTTLALVAALVLTAGIAPLAVADTTQGRTQARGGPAGQGQAGVRDQTGAQNGTDCSFPLTVTDATGSEVTIPEAPDRVIALQPSDAQIMWGIGARDQVVGLPRNQYTAYLADRAHLADGENRTDVKNDDLTVNVEAVVDAQPDLVLAANATSPSTVATLRRANITVYHFGGVTSLEGIYEQINRSGRLTGNCEGAARTVSEMRANVTAIRQAVQGRERPDVLYVFFGYTTGSGTYIDDLIETAGGNNVMADAGLEGFRQANPETVLEQDPEVIVYPSDASVPSGSPYNQTTALAENRTVEVNSNYVSQPGPRVVRPLRTMARAFHPDAFADGQPVTPGTETATPTPTSALTGTDATPTPTSAPTNSDAAQTPTATTSAGGPGPGVPLALAALAGAGVAAARRKGT
ncbi:MAG: PGF-CTERM-anchored ABC transporter substrate-binding protein [Haloarculaceae archaeon]